MLLSLATNCFFRLRKVAVRFKLFVLAEGETDFTSRDGSLTGTSSEKELNKLLHYSLYTFHNTTIPIIGIIKSTCMYVYASTYCNC